jgi:hypothetical protein
MASPRSDLIFPTRPNKPETEPVVAKKDPTKALRHFHARGKRALEEREQREHRDEGVHGTLATLGAKTRPKKNRLMEARRFAALYNDQQLDELCLLGRTTGRLLTRSHVVQLIRVADRRQRKMLAKECAEESWSVRRLEMEIRRLSGRRTYGGRSHEPPQSVDDALRVTERLAGGWIRWVSVLEPVSSGTSRKPNALRKLPGPIGKKLVIISNRIKTLGEEIANKLNKQSSKAQKSSRRRTC